VIGIQGITEPDGLRSREPVSDRWTAMSGEPTLARRAPERRRDGMHREDVLGETSPCPTSIATAIDVGVEESR
jgi:hypothetical protein